MFARSPVSGRQFSVVLTIRKLVQHGGARSRLAGFDLFGRKIHVGGNGLDIVVIFQLFDQFDDEFGGIIIDFDGGAWDAGDLFDFDGGLGGLELFHDIGVDVGGASDFETIFFFEDIIRTSFDRQFHDLVDVRAFFLDGDESFAFEEVGDAIGGAEFAVAGIEDFANFGSGTIAIIGHDIAEDSDSAGAIAFVEDFFDVSAVEFPGPFLDSAFDIIARHTDGFGIDDGGSEAVIGRRITTPEFGGNDDGFGEFAPQLASVGVDGGLSMFDVGPFGMTCHLGSNLSSIS